MSLRISLICRAFSGPASRTWPTATPHNVRRCDCRLRPRTTRIASFSTLPVEPQSASKQPANSAENEKSVATIESKSIAPKDVFTRTPRAEGDAKEPLAHKNPFKASFSSLTDEAIEAKLGTPFVTPARVYPSEIATNRSKEEARRSARGQAGLDAIWGRHKHGAKVLSLTWEDTLELLKKQTRYTASKDRQLSAMRIVLPGSWELEASNTLVEFVDSFKGLKERLRIYSDHVHPSAVVVRGTKRTLAKAADELLRKRVGIEVFQLGQVQLSDYDTKQLWPKIETGEKPVAQEKFNSVWIHKDQPPEYWIETKYEDVPKPEEWSVDDFEAYITKLVCGRLRSHLAAPLYHEQATRGGSQGSSYMVDTDGIRAKLIMDAFTDPKAIPHITPHALKMALNFLAQRGGHRALADRLFTLAEGWGVPMDAETFNIILEGYVLKKDHGYFHMFLRKMSKRYVYANGRTWLLFLRLVEQDSEKRQVCAAMSDLKLLQDPGIARGMAEAMASADAYASFVRSGRDMDRFLQKQRDSYGEQWLTRGALNAVLSEWFKFHGDDPADVGVWAPLAQQTLPDGTRASIDTINLVLAHCVYSESWDNAAMVLNLMRENGCQPDSTTYHHLISLAIKTQSLNALVAAIFHGALDKLLKTPIRMQLRKILHRTHRNDWDDFFNKTPLPLLTAEMDKILRAPPLPSRDKALSKVLQTMVDVCEGWELKEPIATTMATAVLLDRQIRRGKKDAKPLEIRMKKKLLIGDGSSEVSRVEEISKETIEALEDKELSDDELLAELGISDHSSGVKTLKFNHHFNIKIHARPSTRTAETKTNDSAKLPAWNPALTGTSGRQANLPSPETANIEAPAAVPRQSDTEAKPDGPNPLEPTHASAKLHQEQPRAQVPRPDAPTASVDSIEQAMRASRRDEGLSSKKVKSSKTPSLSSPSLITLERNLRTSRRQEGDDLPATQKLVSDLTDPLEHATQPPPPLPPSPPENNTTSEDDARRTKVLGRLARQAELDEANLASDFWEREARQHKIGRTKKKIDGEDGDDSSLIALQRLRKQF